VQPATDRSVPLAEALREGSRADHEHAEASAFVTDLMAGRAHPARYAAYLRRLRVVYAALEAAVRECHADPAVAAVHDESLTRLGALDRDLAHWAPGVAGAPESVAAAAYRERIERAAEHPHLLVAHHYTRYLGDLSGGRMLAQAMRRGYPEHGLAESGLSFYDFAGIPKPVAYKRAYRAALDDLVLEDAVRAAMVEEVREAFRLNRALLDEVGSLEVGREAGEVIGCR
jgi:heme oxygenase